MVQTSAATTRFTMLQGMDSPCTVTWKQNLGRPGHLSCLGASKTSYSRTLGTFQISKLKVKLCDNRCYCPPPPLPPPLCAYLTSQCHLKRELEKNGHRLRIPLRSLFLKQKHLTSLTDNCIQKREGKRKHAWLFVCLTGSSKYCNFEQFCFL